MAAPPTEPALPDATVDPFGAMNAMAQRASEQQQAPAIVIVNDGKPVESVAHKRPFLRYLKIAGIILAPFIIGFLIGGINYERSLVGRTIEDAKLLKKEMHDVGVRLNTLSEILLAAKDAGGGRFQPLDKDLTDKLAAVDLGLPEEDTKLFLFHAYLFNMQPKLVTDTLLFYGKLRTLQVRLKDHVRLSQSVLAGSAPDPTASLAKDVPFKAGNQGPMKLRYGAIVRVPTGDQHFIPYVEVVQLGAPLCDDNNPHPDGCGPAKPKGFNFRNDPTDTNWSQKLMATDQPAADMIMPVGPSGILLALEQGSQSWYDAVAYMQRVIELDTMCDALTKDRVDLEARMGALAGRGKPLAL